jgi:preflagellin peptidase FlaK
MLGYSSWVDLKTREIYDLVWMVFGTIGFAMVLYEIYIGTVTVFWVFLPLVFSVLISITLGYLGLYGGADVEAFIVLSILHPFPPRGMEPILGIVSIIYPLTLFSNSAISGASFSIILFVKNLFSLASDRNIFQGLESNPWWKRLIVMFTGLKMNLDTIRGPPFQYPLEIPSNKDMLERRLILFPNIHCDDAANDMFNQLKGAGIQKVWVSSTLPFLVFITVGYLITLFLGDIALTLLNKLFYLL